MHSAELVSQDKEHSVNHNSPVLSLNVHVQNSTIKHSKVQSLVL